VKRACRPGRWLRKGAAATAQRTIIRRGRLSFIALVGAYTLGNFNDNFNKQAVSLLALAHHRGALQGVFAMVFTIPFLLFAAPAGWLADRYPRRRVIIVAKVLELVFLCVGGVGILTLDWPLIIAVIFVMAVQATIFSPALNGSIPDIYPEGFVVHANARLTAATTAGILLGITVAGIALNTKGTLYGLPANRLLVASSMALIGCIGLAVSFGIPSHPAGDPKEPFPWGGPLSSLKDLWSLRGDRRMVGAMLAVAYFWFVAVLQVLFINAMGIVQFGLNDATTSYLVVAELLGVVAGALTAKRFIVSDDDGLWITPIAAGGLGLSLLLSGLSPLLPADVGLGYLLTMLICAGASGGMMLVPLSSFFQTRPTAQRRGRVIAASGFAGSVGLLLGSAVYIPLSGILEPTSAFIPLGLVTLSAAVALAVMFARRKPGQASWLAKGLCLCGRRILALRYHVTVDGAARVRQRGRDGILFLPNHPALIDPVILIAWLQGRFAVRPLAATERIDLPMVRIAARLFGVIQIPTPSQFEGDNAAAVQQALQQCIEALKNGENVLFYPAGRLMRQRFEVLGGVSGAHFLVAQLPEIQVVLIRTTGLWGSSFSWARGTPPSLTHGFWGHARKILASGVFFAPKRDVQVEIREPDDLPRHADRLEFNAYLDRFYNDAAPPARYLPYSLWEKGGSRDLPEVKPLDRHSSQDAPAATREIVVAHLQQETGAQSLNEDLDLAQDLGMDSLATVALILWLEEEFAVAVPGVEALRTVGDVILAASGQLSAESADVHIPKPASAWLASPRKVRVQLPDGNTLQEVFLARARAAPDRVIAADMRQGILTYRQMITAIFALRARIAALPGPYVAILLPASVAADTVFFATLFAGKIPVMINWTTGSRAVQAGLDMLGIQKVLTADALLRRLAPQGLDLTAVEDRLVRLETLAGEIGWGEKLFAALRARLSWRSLVSLAAVDTAVVLYTSGSEALPKAVPLTHANLLANIRDVLSSLALYENDSLLGMLPPFHSFGLTGTMLLPLLSGIRVVHHPDPNAVGVLSKIIADYCPTLLPSTPTFIANIVRASGRNDLRSLRICVTGAEKCPLEVYEALRSSCPQAVILEGYGITECSPILAVMREDDVQPGTVGKPMPSVVTAIVDIDSHLRVEAGRTGMLLVRGPSIFGGYLHDTGPSPFEVFDGETWYRTGDLVKADTQDRLTFMGRLTRFAKIGGEMISLPAIEAVLSRRYALPEDTVPCLAVLTTPSDVHPELVLWTIRPLERAQVNRTLQRGGLSGLHNIRIVREIAQIPLLGTGKIDYRTLAHLLAEKPSS